jgi:feruloyl-CoA synthase
VTRSAAYRQVALGPTVVEARRDPGGGHRLRSPAPLGKYPARITERLLHWAQECPEHTFVAKRVNGGDWRRISYREALAQARRLGRGLLERGLSAERPLMTLSGNDLEHAMLALAALYVGVPFVPVSPAYSLVSQDYGKLRHAVQLMTPGLVFAADRTYEKAIAAAVPAQTEVLYSLEKLLAADDDTVDAAHAAIRPDSICKFLLTSGSTGMPKAVIHTQQMLASNQQMIVDCMPFLAVAPPVLVDWLPWNHTFGGSHNYGLALYNGGTLYIDEGRPAPKLIEETLRNLREIAPTVYFNVPRGFEEIARALEGDAALARMFFSRVQMLFYAAASLSQPIWDALHRLAEKSVGERILMITGLGMTETAPFAICANWEAGRSGGIGHPAPGTEVRLAPVEGKLEVRYKGPNVTPGYWRQDELTRAAFDDEGYFRSGDAARFIDPTDAQKGLAFDGRIAEDFKLDSGTWVSVGPLRAQVIAAGDPWVQDAVIAGHDRRDVCALVIPRPGTQAPDLQGLLDTLAARSTGGSTRIARALLLAAPLSIDAGEITDKGSINQRAVLAARADLVEMLYTEPYGPQVLRAKT